MLIKLTPPDGKEIHIAASRVVCVMPAKGRRPPTIHGFDLRPDQYTGEQRETIQSYVAIEWGGELHWWAIRESVKELEDLLKNTP